MATDTSINYSHPLKYACLYVQLKCVVQLNSVLKQILVVYLDLSINTSIQLQLEKYYYREIVLLIAQRIAEELLLVRLTILSCIPGLDLIIEKPEYKNLVTCCKQCF